MISGLVSGCLRKSEKKPEGIHFGLLRFSPLSKQLPYYSMLAKKAAESDSSWLVQHVWVLHGRKLVEKRGSIYLSIGGSVLLSAIEAMDTVALKPKLTRLNLSGILDTLGSRLEQAQGEKWSYSQFLDFLLSDEVERRDHKQLVRRLSKSGLDPEKTLATFDFTFNPKIHEPAIRELATCRFLEKNECLLLLGPSGVGKSHLAQAIGNEAVRRGYEVLYRRTSSLLGWVAAGEGDGSRERRLRQTATVAVLILDDFGMKPLSEAQQSDLYELICERYERAPTIITSNRDFNEWPMIFANPLMGSAAMDRLVHRASKIVIEGKSYRVDAFIQRTRRLSGEQPEEESSS